MEQRGTYVAGDPPVRIDIYINPSILREARAIRIGGSTDYIDSDYSVSFLKDALSEFLKEIVADADFLEKLAYAVKNYSYAEIPVTVAVQENDNDYTYTVGVAKVERVLRVRFPDNTECSWVD